MTSNTQTLAEQSPPVLTEYAHGIPLTRVLLDYVEQRFNLYLRFGHPAQTRRLNHRRSIALFAPGTLFCRIRWEANDYGTTRWQLLVLQAGTLHEPMQRIADIWPGASVLLQADGDNQVRAVLTQIDAIEALGLDPTQVSQSYWRTLGNRLRARMPLSAYTCDRHVAWIAGSALH
jgi:hypothetical protein